jgi:SAM-dependent methyltransferase
LLPAQFQLHADIEERHWWFVARRRILRAIIGQVLPPSSDTTLIDVGCGTGANLASLASEYRCVGIDTSADAIRLAKERFPQTQFIQGYAPDDLGSLVNEARLVLMTDVLEHVPDDFSLFSAVAAAVQPGTFLLITVPADLRLWSGHDESFGHYRRYDARRLSKIWQGLPLEPLLVSHFNRRLYPLIKTVRAINRWRGPDRVAGRSGTDFSLPAAPLNRLLENVFAGEASKLCRAIRTGRSGYRKGVSLIALLERREGWIDVRGKPESIEPDYFNPAARVLTQTA